MNSKYKDMTTDELLAEIHKEVDVMKSNQETDRRTKAWADVDVVKVFCYGYGGEAVVHDVDLEDIDCIVARHCKKINELQCKVALTESLFPQLKKGSKKYKELDEAYISYRKEIDTEKERFDEEHYDTWYDFDNSFHYSGVDVDSEFEIKGYKANNLEDEIITQVVNPSHKPNWKDGIDWLNIDTDLSGRFVIGTKAGEKGTFWNGEIIWKRKNGSKNRFDIDKLEFGGDGVIHDGDIDYCTIGSIGYDDTDECAEFIDGLSEDYETRGKSFEVDILVKNGISYTEFYSMLHKVGRDTKEIKKILALTQKVEETELV